jgi:hypothetical protein
MKSINEIIRENEVYLGEIINWQIDHDPTSNFLDFARSTGNIEELIKYSIILLPRFICVEGAIVLENKYDENNWNIGRKTRKPIEVARAINHVHIEEVFYKPGNSKLEKALGEILVIFWQMAVDRQFPNESVQITFDGEIIDIAQQ